MSEEEQKKLLVCVENFQSIQKDLEVIKREVEKAKTYLIVFLVFAQLIGIPIITQIVKMLLEGR